jgi:hypothetical protein
VIRSFGDEATSDLFREQTLGPLGEYRMSYGGSRNENSKRLMWRCGLTISESLLEIGSSN